MKKVLITGAARGLGKELRDYLLGNGYFVYGTTRNTKHIIQSKNLKIMHLDLTDAKSIERVGNYFLNTVKSLDAVIHNSGIAYLDPADVLDEEECRHIFDINFFGPIFFTKKLLPILKDHNTKTNLIFISSIVSIDHWPHLGVYAASKAALEAVAFEWAALLKNWNIHVSVIQPNPLPTNMQILRSKNAKNSPYPELSNRILKWEDPAYVCNLVQKILEGKLTQFFHQTGPHSEETAQNFLNLSKYQQALEMYQKTHTISNI